MNLNIKYGYLIIQLLLIPIIGNCQDYFEGKIHYKVEYEKINQNIPDGFLETQMGDSFDAFVKEDKYLMIYNTKGELGTIKTLIRLDEGYSYLIAEKSDTIYKSPLDNEKDKLLKLVKITDNKKEILGEMCDFVVLEYETNNPDNFFKISRGKHYYNPKYKLNPEKYKNHISGFWNQYVDAAQAISIRNEHEYEGLFKSVSYATEIEQQSIPDDMFMIDNTKIIKLEE